MNLFGWHLAAMGKVELGGLSCVTLATRPVIDGGSTRCSKSMIEPATSHDPERLSGVR